MNRKSRYGRLGRPYEDKNIWYSFTAVLNATVQKVQNRCKSMFLPSDDAAKPFSMQHRINLITSLCHIDLHV